MSDLDPRILIEGYATVSPALCTISEDTVETIHGLCCQVTEGSYAIHSVFIPKADASVFIFGDAAAPLRGLAADPLPPWQADAPCVRSGKRVEACACPSCDWRY